MLSLATASLNCRYRSKNLQGTLKNAPFLPVPVQRLDRYPQLLLFLIDCSGKRHLAARKRTMPPATFHRYLFTARPP